MDISFKILICGNLHGNMVVELKAEKRVSNEVAHAWIGLICHLKVMPFPGTNALQTGELLAFDSHHAARLCSGKRFSHELGKIIVPYMILLYCAIGTFMNHGCLEQFTAT